MYAVPAADFQTLKEKTKSQNSPASALNVLRTLLASWTTSKRMAESTARCIFGCPDDDRFSRYLACKLFRDLVREFIKRHWNRELRVSELPFHVACSHNPSDLNYYYYYYYIYIYTRRRAGQRL